MEYKARSGSCAACLLRSQCTKAKLGRTLKRHAQQEALDVARRQAHSRAARRDRKRRQQLMEQSFADATNNHHFKRARWRRLWRQQIQDYLIAAIQNLRILLAHSPPKHSAAKALVLPAIFRTRCLNLVRCTRWHPFSIVLPT
jgi:chorismate mutase